jgi:hypothetical protein
MKITNWMENFFAVHGQMIKFLAGDLSQIVECLSIKCRALSSNPSTTKYIYIPKRKMSLACLQNFQTFSMVSEPSQ